MCILWMWEIIQNVSARFFTSVDSVWHGIFESMKNMELRSNFLSKIHTLNIWQCKLNANTRRNLVGIVNKIVITCRCSSFRPIDEVMWFRNGFIASSRDKTRRSSLEGKLVKKKAKEERDLWTSKLIVCEQVARSNQYDGCEKVFVL